MQQYHLINLYSILSWVRWSSSLLPVRPSPDEGECQIGEAALRISEIDLMKPLLRLWSVEEGRVRRVLI